VRRVSAYCEILIAGKHLSFKRQEFLSNQTPHTTIIKSVNSNLVQYLQKRTENIQWQMKTLHRDFSPGNPKWENQHILYSFIVLQCLQYKIYIGASGIQNPNPMTWISPKP
jgi:hypothetical protein